MKAKIGFLLAAFMMLFSVCANAQSNGTPVKGDVNEDGVVDIADINAIIDIMKNGGGTGGETKYYWYAGIVYPSDPNSSAQNNTFNKWTVLTSTPSSIHVETEWYDDSVTWYVAIPHSYNFVSWDSDGSAEEPNAYNKSENALTINGVNYDLFTTTGLRNAINAVFKK